MKAVLDRIARAFGYADFNAFWHWPVIEEAYRNSTIFPVAIFVLWYIGVIACRLVLLPYSLARQTLRSLPKRAA